MTTEPPIKRKPGRPRKNPLPLPPDQPPAEPQEPAGVIKARFIRYFPNWRIGQAEVDGEPKHFHVSNERVPGRRKIGVNEVIDLVRDESMSWGLRIK